MSPYTRLLVAVVSTLLFAETSGTRLRRRDVPSFASFERRLQQGASTSRTICTFGIFRNGRTTPDAARTDNVVFRSNGVLVVQEAAARLMIFAREGGVEGNSAMPYCHEQAEIACGDASTGKATSLLQGNASTVACADRAPCTPNRTPDLSYIKSMLAGAVEGRKGQIKRAASIGLGAGTIPLWLSRVMPDATIEAIDISPDVIAAAPCFGLSPSDTMQLVQEDGRKYISEQPDGSFDVIFIDAFDDRDIIPTCLKTVEFFKMIDSKLAGGGVLSMNVWRRELDNVYASVAEAFPGRVQVGMSPGLGNIVLLAHGKGASTRPWANPAEEAEGVSDAKEWARQAGFETPQSASRDDAGASSGESLSLLYSGPVGPTMRKLYEEGHDLGRTPGSAQNIQLRDQDICTQYAQ